MQVQLSLRCIYSMTKTFLSLPLWTTSLVLVSCAPANPPLAMPNPDPSFSTSSTATPTATPIASPSSSPVASTPNSVSNDAILQESWQAYKQRFIQGDGRVIDREANDRTVSEGQAYAMLRAVFVGDRETFDRTLNWAESNLRRTNPDGSLQDTLWAWKWGRDSEGNWRTIDDNFASDGDLDAVTALILASRQWNHADYLKLARTKLKDLWERSTFVVDLPRERSNLRSASPWGNRQSIRFFLPGPTTAFVQADRVYLNPSYLAPAALRLFAQVDPDRDWMSLVESSYLVLNQSASLSKIGLPSDWVQFDRATGKFDPVSPPNSLQSLYAFDAYRVWWRVATDAIWFDAAPAKEYLQRHLRPIQTTWQTKQAIPARINLQGEALVGYESTAQYAMLYAAFSVIDPALAEQIRQQKLLPTYHNGFWDNDSAYYTQNLCWFGLSFPNTHILQWLKAASLSQTIGLSHQVANQIALSFSSSNTGI